MKIKKEPELDWQKVIAGGLIYLGFLLFLVALHIVAINTDGDTQSVMNTVFLVFLSIYMTAIFFGLGGLIIQFLRWLTWIATTPKWLRKKGRTK